MSISPGRMVTSPRSIRFASAGMLGRAVLPVTRLCTRPSSAITRIGLSSVTPLTGSNMCAAVTTVAAGAPLATNAAARATNVSFMDTPLKCCAKRERG
jgi:hypothetical protein